MGSAFALLGQGGKRARREKQSLGGATALKCKAQLLQMECPADAVEIEAMSVTVDHRGVDPRRLPQRASKRGNFLFVHNPKLVELPLPVMNGNRWPVMAICCSLSFMRSSIDNADGYEALTQLEKRGFDLLLVNGEESNRKPGLSGIAGDELSHMWRQIEGRAAHLVIGYVSNVEMREAARSRFVSNPANLARNRGIDHHFWSDEEDHSIAAQLLGDLAERRLSARQTVERALDGNVMLWQILPKEIF